MNIYYHYDVFHDNMKSGFSFMQRKSLNNICYNDIKFKQDNVVSFYNIFEMNMMNT